MNTVVIEVVKKQSCFLSDEEIKSNCKEYLQTQEIHSNEIISLFNDKLSEFIQCIILEETENSGKIDLNDSNIKWYIYSLHNIGGQAEYLQNENESEISTTNWMIPASDFHGLWESLIYDSQIKQDLLKYVSTTMLFSDKGVDSNIVCSNRVVLLHGPPGTGKTSLCKALAQKLAIRLKHRYPHGQFIEINSHSLFSKWFSESGKLVTNMFSKIFDMIEDPNAFLCILIDEIESLAHARNQCVSGNEPSDAIRVVNAVLTQIDQIRRYSNVLILTTSNMTAAIDLAFVDRADIKQYIGLPSIHAIYQIYHSCIKELMRTAVISPHCEILSANILKLKEKDIDCQYSEELLRICELGLGFSGRTLRKVPFIAHALFAKSVTLTLTAFLECMVSATEYLKAEKQYFV